MRPRLAHAYACHRFAVMFYSFLLVILSGPVLEELGLDRRLGQVIVAANLAAVTAGMTSGAIRRTLVVLILAGIAIVGLPESVATAHGLSPAVVLWSLLAYLGTHTVVRFALFSPEVSGEHVYAALNAYLIAGLYLGVVYHAIDGGTPGSFLSSALPGTRTTSRSPARSTSASSRSRRWATATSSRTAKSLAASRCWRRWRGSCTWRC